MQDGSDDRRGDRGGDRGNDRGKPAGSRYRELFERAPIGFFLLDAELRIVACNDRLAEIARTPRAALEGVDMRTRGDRRLVPYLEAALAGEGSTYEGPLLTTTSGRELQISMSAAPVRGSDGGVNGVMVLLEDTTERMAAKEALTRSEARFRALIEASPDAIGVHRDGVWIFANPALVALLGVESSSALLGRKTSEHVAQPEEGLLRAPKPGERRTPREVRLIRQDGKTVTAEVVSINIDFDGAPAIVSLGRDTTERSRLRARMLEADRMASVGTLAAGVAHEINNPLAYIIANLDVIALRRLPRLLTEARALPGGDDTAAGIAQLGEMLEVVRDGANRVREIVRDLKTFSRADHDRRDPVDIRRVIDAAVNVAWNEIRHRAKLVKRYEEIPAVYANESRLGQVFVNLLVNAAQALPIGSASSHTITVSVASGSNGTVIATVSDTGPGIPSEIRERIFDPFFTTKPVGVGTGLGLSICQGIVGALGGRIEVAATNEQGTSIVVVLPIGVERKQRMNSGSFPAVRPGRRTRVLVIDDELALLQVMRDALGDDFDVTTLSSGRAAIDHLTNDAQIDVVLCDLMMPDVSGADVFRWIEANRPALTAHVVFVTGGAFSAVDREFIDALPNARVDKPFSLQALVKAVRDVAG